MGVMIVVYSLTPRYPRGIPRYWSSSDLFWSFSVAAVSRALRRAAAIDKSTFPVQKNVSFWETNMGVSENSVPLNPMVNDHYPY